MKSDKLSPLLYAVTDRAWLNGETLYNQIEKALKGGATVIQLREKNLGFNEFLSDAKDIKRLCLKYNVPLIINDNIDIAIEADADGVHLGQDDMNVCEARKKLGLNKIIGVSAHNVKEAINAQKAGADYLGSGAVFSTGTKNNVSSMSYDTLKNICESVNIPVVAIGGITKKNIVSLKGSGISGAAVVSAIFAKPDIERAAFELKQLVLDIV